MKQINYIIAVLLVILAFSCADDKGNYDYKQLNDISISGISDTGYIVNTQQNLTITPEFEMAIKEDESNLSYSWKINHEEVSTERNLNYEIPLNSKFGKNSCRYTITNTDTGVKYFFDFDISVMSAFNLGYYILSQEEDNSSLISYYPVNYTDESEWLYTKYIGDKKIGDFPSQIGKKYSHFSEFSDYGWFLYILTQEGEYNYIETNSFTFAPTSLANASSYITNPHGVEFAPKSLTIGNAATYFQTGNGAAIYSKGLLNPPAHVEQVYDWEQMGLYEMGQVADKLWGFDNNTSKLYTLYYTANDPLNGIVGNKFSYDNIEEVSDLPSLDGQKFLTVDISKSYAPDYSSGTTTITMVLNKENTSIHMVQKKIKTDYKTGISEESVSSSEMEVSGLTDESTCKIFGNNYYFLIGNALYSSPILNPAITKVIDIPAEFGKPLVFSEGVDDQRLWIATYNETSSEELKGSVLVVDAANKVLEHSFKNVCAKPVDVCTTDGSPWW